VAAVLAKVYSAAVLGVEAFEVEIEVNAGHGSPVIVIVGLPDTAVKESRDRVITAIQNSGYHWPRGRTTINLAPADVKKEGPSFDLPIALGMIAANEEIELPNASEFCIVGELALTGAIRPVRGALPIAIEARRNRKRALFVPEGNAREAAVVEGIDVYGVRNLRETFEFLNGQRTLTPVREDLRSFFAEHQTYELDFADVKGQQNVKRAIEVAVSGGHNLLMIGPPGSGKSMLSKRMPGIIPPMTLDEAIDTTKIHSICGLLDVRNSFVATRPFRAPHHTISDVGLLGGSANPTPGEVSLAHNGVLFLDELPEFKRSTLEVMRQPLEDGKVTISRAAGSMTFPAEFMLVAAMNPCPCGFWGDPKRECRCSPAQVQKYRQRISGPLLDRIDIHVDVPAVQFKEISSGDGGELSEVIRQRVERARLVQQQRFAKNGRTSCNARMSAKLIKQFCAIDDAAQGILKMAMTELSLSARAYDRILKVGRTIADLEGEESIQAHHIGEAIQYRTLDRNLWS
jgi:magnesium chelatase family protein